MSMPSYDQTYKLILVKEFKEKMQTQSHVTKYLQWAACKWHFDDVIEAWSAQGLEAFSACAFSKFNE